MQVREDGVRFKNWELREVLPEQVYDYIDIIRDYLRRPVVLKCSAGEIRLQRIEDGYGFYVEVRPRNFDCYKKPSELAAQCESVIETAQQEGVFDQLCSALLAISILDQLNLLAVLSKD